MRVERFTLFDFFTYLFFIVLSFSFLYPLLNQFAMSVSDAKQLEWQTIGIFPVGWSLDSYKMLLSDNRIMRYYGNTIMYAVSGTLVMLITTSMLAYPLTFPDFRGKKLIVILLTITMFFSGGLIPYYLVVLALGLVDTIWALILPGAITAWNVIIFRTFFQTIPDALKDAAHMDGAGHFAVLFRVVVPLSKPLLATFTLFSVVGFWNDWFNALIFLRSQSKFPVQLLLRRLVVLMDYRDMQSASDIELFQNLNARTVKSAALIITILPILCVYPFLQRYFTKGLLVGSLKA